MSIVHALVAYGRRILTETSLPGSKDFSHATATILSKIPPNDSRLTYSAESYLFHYVKNDDVVYMCMADDNLGRKVPFTFLSELQRKFEASFTREEITTAQAYNLAEFNPLLSELMKKSNDTPSLPDPIRQAQDELTSVKDIMVQNVEQILSRGERIELLVDKTDTLSSQAGAFRRRSQALRRQMWWKNTKLMAISAVVVILFMYILMAQVCGAGLHCGTT